MKTTRVYEAVAQSLVESGVECIFGIIGDDTAPVIVAALARGIAYHSARHENQAIAMADGFARATGKIGVATVTGGPGLSNALTAINTAHRAGSRVVVLIGAGRVEEDELHSTVIRKTTAVGWIKFFPQTAMLELLDIPTFKPRSAQTVASCVRDAFEQAIEGTAALVLGRDLLLANMEAVEGTEQGGGQENPAASPRPPAPEQLEMLVELLQETWAVKRPVILAGRGALKSGAGPALQRLAELTGALLATSLGARALFHGAEYDVGVCGSYATSVASELIVQADCVLAFGAGLNKFTTYDNSLFPKALLVHVDAQEDALGRFLDAELAIHADARLTAEALVAELESRGHQAAGFRSEETSGRIRAFRKSDDVKDKSKPGLVDPRVLMLELDRILPAGRIVCVDAGQNSRFAIRYLGVDNPHNFMQSVDSGSIGLGLGTGIGAAVGRPTDLVVVAVGDGGMMMSLGDLETAVRLRLPMLVVISNDEALGSEVNVLSTLGLDPSVAQIPSPSFTAIATAMGAQAAVVRSIADLAVVGQWLREPMGRPLVLDCRINPEVRAS